MSAVVGGRFLLLHRFAWMDYKMGHVVYAEQYPIPSGLSCFFGHALLHSCFSQLFPYCISQLVSAEDLHCRRILSWKVGGNACSCSGKSADLDHVVHGGETCISERDSCSEATFGSYRRNRQFGCGAVVRKSASTDCPFSSTAARLSFWGECWCNGGGLHPVFALFGLLFFVYRVPSKDGEQHYPVSWRNSDSPWDSLRAIKPVTHSCGSVLPQEC